MQVSSHRQPEKGPGKGEDDCRGGRCGSSTCLHALCGQKLQRLVLPLPVVLLLSLLQLPPIVLLPPSLLKLLPPLPLRLPPSLLPLPPPQPPSLLPLAPLPLPLQACSGHCCWCRCHHCSRCCCCCCNRCCIWAAPPSCHAHVAYSMCCA